MPGHAAETMAAARRLRTLSKETVKRDLPRFKAQGEKREGAGHAESSSRRRLRSARGVETLCAR